MANKLNLTGLTYFYNRIKTVFASQDDLDALSDRVDEIVSEGGEPNTIESISKNGTAIAPDANKNVNIPVPTTVAEMSDAADYALAEDIPTKVSDLENDGDGTQGSAFATEDYVDQNGGKIDKIKVNSTEQTIDPSDKSVNIQVPTDLSDLDNLDQDPYAKMSDVESAQVGALKPKGSVAFASLPALTAANLNTYYNVSDSFTTTADFIEGAGKTYPAGTNVAIINTGTDANPVYKYDAMVGMTDLSGYWSKSELVDVTTAEIDAIIAGS